MSPTKGRRRVPPNSDYSSKTHAPVIPLRLAAGLLIADDPNNAEIVKSVLSGRDVKRYGYLFHDTYLLFIPWHFPLHTDAEISGPSDTAEALFAERYPAIYSHLKKFEDKLWARNQEEVGKRYEWYALQRCAASYYPEFDKEKIAWGNLTVAPSFSLVPSGYFISAPTNMLTVDDQNIYVMLAILNSTVTRYQLDRLTYSREGGYREYKKMFVEQVIVPNVVDSVVADKLETLVRDILNQKKDNPKCDTTIQEAEIDELVMNLYELTDEEKAIVAHGRDNSK